MISVDSKEIILRNARKITSHIETKMGESSPIDAVFDCGSMKGWDAVLMEEFSGGSAVLSAIKDARFMVDSVLEKRSRLDWAVRMASLLHSSPALFFASGALPVGRLRYADLGEQAGRGRLTWSALSDLHHPGLILGSERERHLFEVVVSAIMHLRRKKTMGNGLRELEVAFSLKGIRRMTKEPLPTKLLAPLYACFEDGKAHPDEYEAMVAPLVSLFRAMTDAGMCSDAWSSDTRARNTRGTVIFAVNIVKQMLMGLSGRDIADRIEVSRQRVHSVVVETFSVEFNEMYRIFCFAKTGTVNTVAEMLRVIEAARKNGSSWRYSDEVNALLIQMPSGMKRYQQKRSNVIRSGIRWDLEPAEFIRIWVGSGHHQDAGRGKESFAMGILDRKKGYVAGNVIVALKGQVVVMSRRKTGRSIKKKGVDHGKACAK